MRDSEVAETEAVLVEPDGDYPDQEKEVRVEKAKAGVRLAILFGATGAAVIAGIANENLAVLLSSGLVAVGVGAASEKIVDTGEAIVIEAGQWAKQAGETVKRTGQEVSDVIRKGREAIARVPENIRLQLGEDWEAIKSSLGEFERLSDEYKKLREERFWADPVYAVKKVGNEYQSYLDDDLRSQLAQVTTRKEAIELLSQLRQTGLDNGSTWAENEKEWNQRVKVWGEGLS